VRADAGPPQGAAGPPLRVGARVPRAGHAAHRLRDVHRQGRRHRDPDGARGARPRRGGLRGATTRTTPIPGSASRSRSSRGATFARG
jgi:hypothetical protein